MGVNMVSNSSGIDKAKSDWEKANAAGDRAGMQAAHDRAESIRNAAGYSGGEDGSQYLPNGWGNTMNGYNSAADSAAALYRQAAQQGANSLRSLIPGLENQYSDISRQAYKNYMFEQKGTGQQLAKLGLGGQGFAESTIANNSSAYQKNVIDSEIAKKKAISEINMQAEQVIAGGDLEAGQAKVDAQMQIAKEYPNYLAAQQAQKNWLNSFEQAQQNWQNTFSQNQQGKDLAQQNWNATQSAKATAEQQSMALARAKLGDFSALKALGIDTTSMERAFYYNLYN